MNNKKFKKCRKTIIWIYKTINFKNNQITLMKDNDKIKILNK